MRLYDVCCGILFNQDLGLDGFQQTTDDRLPQPLFPPISLPPPSNTTQTDTYCIKKMRDLSFRYVHGAALETTIGQFAAIYVIDV